MSRSLSDITLDLARGSHRKRVAHSLLGARANIAELSAQIGIVARNVSIPDPPLDIMRITGSGEGLERFLLHQSKPLYERRLLGLF